MGCPVFSRYADDTILMEESEEELKSLLMKVKRESEVIQSCPTLSDPMDCSLSGSSIHGISRQEYWSGVPFPSPGSLPDSGVEHGSLTLQADSLLSEPPRKPIQFQFSSVQFSHSVVSDSLRPHEPDHARPPHPSPIPRVHPNPCPLSQ